jgi:uncharacterized damage-inducible protein DinB
MTVNDADATRHLAEPRGGTMKLSDSLVAELEREAEATRRVLARVPEEKLDWRPHPRSMSLGQLAMHVAGLPDGVTRLIEPPVAEVPTVPLPEAASRNQILFVLEGSVRAAAARLAAWDDADLLAEWRMTHAGETVLRIARLGMVRSILLNHWYHHRGQLTVYLRLLDVQVPAVYGASADEPAPVG